jgi:general secretion pathway protein J
MSRLTNTRGYTLVEILIALFVFAIFGLMTSTIISNMLINKRTTQSALSSLDSLQFAITLLNQDFRQVVTHEVMKQLRQKEISLTGKEDEILFYRGGNINPNAFEKRASISQVHYRLDNNALCRETTFNLNASHLEKKGHNRLCLLRNVQSLKIDYLNETLAKTSYWQKDKLPTAINLTINHKSLGELSLFYALPQALIVTKKLKP